MAELTCQDFVELVTEYLEGALDEDTVRQKVNPTLVPREAGRASRPRRAAS